MISMATVDVIIPAFNAAKYLPFALESVLSQTFDDWQILLVDDGSTDETVAIARELNLPVRYVGVGEKMDDLLEFSAPEFVESLLG